MTTKKAAASAEKQAKAAKKKTGKKRERKARLSPRQRKLLHGIVIEQKAPYRAALEAGYSPNTAKDAGDLLDTAAMRKALANLLASPEKIAQRINEGLDAVQTEFAKFEGKITDSINVVAWGERRQYAELAARLKGLTPGVDYDPAGEGSPTSITVNFINVAALAEA